MAIAGFNCGGRKVMESMPKVSVIVPAYNAARTIERALTSVEAQTYSNIELIVVDDASSDGTAAIVQELAPAAQVIRCEQNAGAAAARNRGIKAATGEFIAFLDSDDEWLPEKIARQAEILANCDRVSLVTCDTLIYRSDGTIASRSHAKRPPASGPDAWRHLLASNFIPTPTVMARREQVIEVGAFNPLYPVAEDLDLWLRLALRGEVFAIPEVFVRVHAQPRGLMATFRDREFDCLFQIVRGYMDANKYRLTPAEVKQILGRRYFDIASWAFDQRRYHASIGWFWEAARHGYRPLKSSANVPRAFLGHVAQLARGGAPSQ